MKKLWNKIKLYLPISILYFYLEIPFLKIDIQLFNKFLTESIFYYVKVHITVYKWKFGFAIGEDAYNKHIKSMMRASLNMNNFDV